MPTAPCANRQQLPNSQTLPPREKPAGFIQQVHISRILITAWLALFLSLLVGCSTNRPLHVERLAQFTPQSKRLVLLTTTRYDNKLRTALTKQGFTVLKFASTKTVVTAGDANEVAAIYEKAEAAYALSFTYDIADSCMGNDSMKLDATLEVTDLSKNQVVFVIERCAWTGQCAWEGRGPNIFEQLAEAVAQEWNNSQ